MAIDFVQVNLCFALYPLRVHPMDCIAHYIRVYTDTPCMLSEDTWLKIQASKNPR